MCPKLPILVSMIITILSGLSRFHGQNSILKEYLKDKYFLLCCLERFLSGSHVWDTPRQVRSVGREEAGTDSLIKTWEVPAHYALATMKMRNNLIVLVFQICLQGNVNFNGIMLHCSCLLFQGVSGVQEVIRLHLDFFLRQSWRPLFVYF